MNHSQKKLPAIRCRDCNRLLIRAVLEVAEVEIYCKHCKTTYYLRASRPNLAPQDGLYGDRHARNQSSRHP